MAEKNLEEMREAVEAIREKMAAAAREAGRDPAEVQLCAACKTRTADTVAASAALAIDVFGENHVQELCANYDAGAYCGKPSHFIGHLQTNKIKKVLGRASLIQSVDSEHLLAAIEKEAAKAGIVQDVLLEVNIGGEESKSGVSPEQLWPLLDAAAAEEHIRVKGLMAIPPVNDCFIYMSGINPYNPCNPCLIYPLGKLLMTHLMVLMVLLVLLGLSVTMASG